MMNGSLDIFHALLDKVLLLFLFVDTGQHKYSHHKLMKILSEECDGEFPCEFTLLDYFPKVNEKIWFDPVPDISASDSIKRKYVLEAISRLRYKRKRVMKEAKIPKVNFRSMGYWLRGGNLHNPKVQGCGVLLFDWAKSVDIRVAVQHELIDDELYEEQEIQQEYELEWCSDIEPIVLPPID